MPTVVMQYPAAQKGSSVNRRSWSNSRWICTALWPFGKPTVWATLNFGGMLRHPR